MNTNNDMQTQFPNTVGIIGFGKLGSVLAQHFSGLCELSWIVIKNNASKNVLGLSTSILDSIQQIQVIPQLIILAVPDDEIEPCSAQLSMHLKQNTDTFIIHCSGALGKDILQSCKNKGARIAAIHPFQTFFGQVNLQGIPWSIDADEENQSLCNSFIEQVKGVPIVLSDDILRDKSLYHIAAVISSNFLVVLTQLASDLCKTADIDPSILLPLIMKTSLQNALHSLENNQPPIEALTGPIKRGDTQTINKHISVLEYNSDILKIYTALTNYALHSLELQQHNTKNHADLERLARILTT